MTELTNIPNELRVLPRWVCVEDGSKIPLCPATGKRASITDPMHWGTYEEAVTALLDGKCAYIGFVFAGDGIVGIDIDHAIGEDGFINDDAMRAVVECASYTEISRSGTGLHILVKDDISDFTGKINMLGWEIYTAKRYFLLTGLTIGGYALSPAHDALKGILERHFSQTYVMDTEKPNSQETIWHLEYPTPDQGKVFLDPKPEKIGAGGRHLALVSYCGQMQKAGAAIETIQELALNVNQKYMDPPMSKDEVGQIVRSLRRYRR